MLAFLADAVSPYIAPPSSSSVGNLVTKIWRHESHVIILKHNSYKGTRELRVDGEIRHSSVDRVDQSFETNFDFGRQRDASGALIENDSSTNVLIQIIDFPGLRTYLCKVGSAIIPEDGSLPYEPNSQQLIRVKVSGVQKDLNSVLYKVQAERTDNGLSATTTHTFRDFDQLDMDIRSVFTEGNAHLKSSVPPLPPKHLKMLTDHMADSFIEDRRNDLNIYMQRLVGMPRVERNPDMHLFLFGKHLGKEGATGGSPTASAAQAAAPAPAPPAPAPPQPAPPPAAPVVSPEQRVLERVAAESTPERYQEFMGWCKTYGTCPVAETNTQVRWGSKVSFLFGM